MKFSAHPAPHLPPTRRDRVLRVACVLALLGLALMIWGIFVPTPMPILIGLSVGQAMGTSSFVLYLIVLATDLGIRKKLVRAGRTEKS